MHLPTFSRVIRLSFFDRSSQYVWFSVDPASPFTLSRYMPKLLLILYVKLIENNVGELAQKNNIITTSVV